MVAVMSDAGGYGTGGVSPVIVVGKQQGKTQCNTTDPGESAFKCILTGCSRPI